jgi:hypothetical protein
VKQELLDLDTAIKNDEEKEIVELAVVSVAFTAPATGISFAAAGVDGTGGAQSTWPAIASIADNSFAADSLQLDPGYLVLRAGDVPVGCEADMLARLQVATPETPVKVIFQRRSPPMPQHGWARKACRATTKQRYTQAQVSFLEECFLSSVKGGKRIRDKAAWKMCKEHFKDAPNLWLKQSQIRSWFSRKAAKLKKIAVEFALNNEDSVDGANRANGEESGVADLTIAELKLVLQGIGLSVSGSKAELVARVESAH